MSSPSSPPSDSDPVANLVHDHVAIHRLLLELGKEMEALRSGVSAAPSAPASAGDATNDATGAALHDLRELLFLHFAREEEGLFPFVVEALPDLAWQVQAMAAAHDGICGGLTRLIHMRTTQADAATLLGIFDRFEKAYGEHARVESQLLAAVDAAVSPAQRATLAELVQGL